MLNQRVVVDNRSIYVVPIGDVGASLNAGQTFEDYSLGVYQIQDPRARVQRLLKGGYITQSVENLAFPNISGTYAFDVVPSVWVTKGSHSMTLLMKPGSSSVSGSYTYNGWFREQHTNAFQGPVSGEVSQGGTATLRVSGGEGTYHIVIAGNNIKLTGPDLFYNEPPITLAGTGPGGSVTVPKFLYAMSSGLTQFLTASHDAIKAGTIQVDDLSELLLLTDTHAGARFRWHVDLCEPAKQVLGQNTVAGTGHVEFGKQPNGEWVLTGYDF